MHDGLKVIGFDGLHRCGKSTQIRMLMQLLASEGIPVYALRGDGRRYGTGLEIHDPFSLWWQRNQSFFENLPEDKDGKKLAIDRAYQRTAREIEYCKRRIMKVHGELG